MGPGGATCLPVLHAVIYCKVQCTLLPCMAAAVISGSSLHGGSCVLCLAGRLHRAACAGTAYLVTTRAAAVLMAVQQPVACITCSARVFFLLSLSVRASVLLLFVPSAFDVDIMRSASASDFACLASHHPHVAHTPVQCAFPPCIPTPHPRLPQNPSTELISPPHPLQGRAA